MIIIHLLPTIFFNILDFVHIIKVAWLNFVHCLLRSIKMEIFGWVEQTVSLDIKTARKSLMKCRLGSLGHLNPSKNLLIQIQSLHFWKQNKPTNQRIKIVLFFFKSSKNCLWYGNEWACFHPELIKFLWRAIVGLGHMCQIWYRLWINT